MSTTPYDSYPPAPAYTGSDEDKEATHVDVRYLTRTPSPTPSEAEALSPEKKKRPGILLNLLDPEKLKNPRELIKLLITGAIIALLILFVVYQQNIVNWLKPFADWMRRTPGGWLIPIAILVVLSFPPLFGHEIVAILVGDVWGVGIGFGIIAAGTILGELVTYCVFRWFCMARGRKMEEKKVKYAILSEVIRQGGFKMAVIVRYSAIPGHLTTAIFATCGMNVFIFLAAAFLSLPKQLATVYLGDAQSTDASSRTTHTVKTVVIVATILITIFAMRYVRSEQDKVKEAVIYRRRKARQAKLRVAAGMDPEEALDADPAMSPLLAGPQHGQSSLQGVTVHAPQPAPAPAPAYGFAPAAPYQPSGSSHHSEMYAPALAAPQAGYDARARSPSHARTPSSAPYGSAEGETDGTLLSGLGTRMGGGGRGDRRAEKRERRAERREQRAERREQRRAGW
ncbi:hypothetical protein PYCCODRAFT_1418775 [Trametes coccinea BRFM310]|uniref:Golgi apparatus membrane protein TVP38 n=1 Tax=Trametes coccinea (strain BRFM310) TaxID=1353009 RepID=A0A1Y2I9X3_TRAC3|nr:hypothetical protein PYCCODRAFT_1418775 [Trametes coccinea BRFM310]